MALPIGLISDFGGLGFSAATKMHSPVQHGPLRNRRCLVESGSAAFRFKVAKPDMRSP